MAIKREAAAKERILCDCRVDGEKLFTRGITSIIALGSEDFGGTGYCLGGSHFAEDWECAYLL
jgi:hypothetical protein